MRTLSLHPLTPEEALADLLRTPPPSTTRSPRKGKPLQRKKPKTTGKTKGKGRKKN